MTKAAWTHPDQVRRQVVSATHSRFGAGALNWRETRSAGRAAASSVMVVRLTFPRTAPASPAAFISRSTVQRATTVPSRRWAA